MKVKNKADYLEKQRRKKVNQQGRELKDVSQRERINLSGAGKFMSRKVGE